MTAITLEIMELALESLLFRRSGSIWLVDALEGEKTIYFTASCLTHTSETTYPSDAFWNNSDAEHILDWLAGRILESSSTKVYTGNNA